MDASDEPLWYKDAILYELHVKSFFDSDNDGIGDFRGLLQKLDYLRDLGVTALWLLPFYPSPLRDDGYDIADYRGINESYGSMRDFRAFVREAHNRGLKVITELVINHTSDQHPWFQRARKAKKGSRLRDWYLWSDDDKQWPETRIIFTDTEKSNWTWDPEAGQYYWHRFFSHQPDLNFDNPRVVQAVIDVMRFWLDMGVDGLRLDAIPYLIERDGTNNENLPETHAIIKHLRKALDESHPHAFFLAEANQWPEDTLPYFGDADECHMAFHFPLMPRMYMAMAQEDRHPITDIMRQTPDIPDSCQWAVFLRNHDELTLEMVTDQERDYMWRFYASDSRARINLGIRRRLAPLMDNDRRKIELMNSLLFSMPGTPIIYYGDEIGMGDNFFLGDRDGVRTPMQWSPDRNAGFSRADPPHLFLPPIMDPIYGFESVNVEAQHRSPTSLLNWMRRLMAVRQRHRSFGRGTLTFLYPGNRKILAYVREYDGESILCIANLSRTAQAVELELGRFRGRLPVEMLGGVTFPPIGDLPYLLTLQPYGFYWFILSEEVELPPWHVPLPEPMPDFMTLVLPPGWKSLTAHKSGTDFVREVLPAFIGLQRWFGAKQSGIAAARICESAVLPSDGTTVLATVVEVTLADGQPDQLYFLPLAMHWGDDAVSSASAFLPYTLAKVRRGAKVGALTDATADAAFPTTLVSAIRDGGTFPSEVGEFRGTPGGGLSEIELTGDDEIRRMGVEQSNSSVLLGEKMVLKVYRRLTPGIHPELEIGRFLTDVAKFPNVPPLLGAVEHVDADGTPMAIAVLQGFIRNQGDGWTYTLDYLGRELDEVRLGIDPEQSPAERFEVYTRQAATLGQRIAELHKALCLETGDPAFDPEPMTEDDMARLAASAHERAAAAFSVLERRIADLDAGLRDRAEALLALRRECAQVIDQLVAEPVAGLKTRLHGDLHLGQVLVQQADFVIVDFEGEPSRSIDERRAKSTPLRDVAGMLRSFDYAAAAVLRAGSEENPEIHAEVERQAAEWMSLARDAFLQAYEATIEGTASFPGDPEQARRLLDLLLLEKALYEISYEANNRPGWLDIPVGGVLALLNQRLPPHPDA